MHGIVHTEFVAPDPAALAEFYKAVFGWQVFPSDVGGDYIVWSTGEGDRRQGGGFRGFQPGENREPSGRTIVYIEVADIDAALAEIERRGGTRMIDKTQIGGGHGFSACFGDPAGNTVGLWSPA
jgi:predicted enzyme related to lactoylglutathione lyase